MGLDLTKLNQRVSNLNKVFIVNDKIKQSLSCLYKFALFFYENINCVITMTQNYSKVTNIAY